MIALLFLLCILFVFATPFVVHILACTLARKPCALSKSAQWIAIVAMLIGALALNQLKQIQPAKYEPKTEPNRKAYSTR